MHPALPTLSLIISNDFLILTVARRDTFFTKLYWVTWWDCLSATMVVKIQPQCTPLAKLPSSADSCLAASPSLRDILQFWGGGSRRGQGWPHYAWHRPSRGGHLARQHPGSGYLRKEHNGERFMDGSLSVPGSLSFITAEQRFQEGTCFEEPQPLCPSQTTLVDPVMNLASSNNGANQ
ncbi:hypothetical protein F7725_010265 [Dissostichus mawsoni]|uniref:Uncharacterized protein n=1 Tax=Dissostichus mawsoni TaxID=36200 RepID=A0A7J5XPI5_DISMA|nr:hypothetical protein F7725_010265 [Dissostichus mawsoni]